MSDTEQQAEQQNLASQQTENSVNDDEGIALAQLNGVGLRLDNGSVLEDVALSYRTFGTLNDDKSNVVLVCHALTMDQHLAGTSPVSGKAGWWSHWWARACRLIPTGSS